MKYTSLLLLWCVALSVFSQTSVTYEVNLDNIAHHELRISVTFTGINGSELELQMATASPGRYALHQFAKNVYGEKAFDSNGKPTRIQRTGIDSWKIPVSEGVARFDYILYANHADGTYAGVDSRKVFLNTPAAFIFPKEQTGSITVNFDLDDYPDWQIATQLPATDANTFTAPNYAYFLDSPIMIGKLDFRRWEVDGQTIEMAFMHEGSSSEVDTFTEWAHRIVLQEKAVFGTLPTYDYGRYTFLCAYNPWMYSDGMEHRNSTVCSARANLKDHAGRLIGTIAHEFFHGWNIERIRPRDLEPFDFGKANQSEALWFGEGFTNYYEQLALCRAGIISREEFLENFSARLNQIQNSPGRLFRNPIQMSQNAPFSDAATANDETNYANNYISYYYYGEVLGATLDLMLRSSEKPTTLDVFMRAVWEKFGKTERSYTLDDLRKTLLEVSGNQKLTDTFFDEYIYNSGLPDYQSLLAEFGLSTEKSNPDGIHWGNVGIKNGLVSTPVTIGSPLYEAGAERGDRIFSINGVKVSQSSDLPTLQLKVGERYEITFEQLGQSKSGSFVGKPDPSFAVKLQEKPTKKQSQRLESWLSAK